MNPKLQEFKDEVNQLTQASKPIPTRVDMFFRKAGPWIILVAAILLVFLIFQLGKTSEKVAETEAYTRVTNCIVSKVSSPPLAAQDVELCYVQVEKETGVSLQRFDQEELGD